MSLSHASRLLGVSVIAAALLLSASRLRAVDGDVRMRDPSTIIQADGKFYVYGTTTRAMLERATGFEASVVAGRFMESVWRERLAACLRDSTGPAHAVVAKLTPGMFTDSVSKGVREEVQDSMRLCRTPQRVESPQPA